MPPFFSIIIPTFESASTLEATLQSLAEQSLKDFEVIVSDGASKDRTVEIAESFSARLPHVLISTRPDDGVYDAVNRALTLSNGGWIFILGSDDRLFSADVLEKTKSHLEKSDALFVYGDVVVKGSTNWFTDGQIYDGEFTLEKLLKQNICQQAVFYHRKLFSLIGNFNQRYRIWGDWDFALRVAAQHAMRYIPLTICTYYVGGGLSSLNVDTLFRAEKLVNLMRYFGTGVIGRSFSYLRWDFHKVACRLFSEGRYIQALAAYSTYACLGIRQKLKL